MTVLLLGCGGTASDDHWPRDEAEFVRINAYIENNPVTAGVIVHGVRQVAETKT